jgi:hypothetical protein
MACPDFRQIDAMLISSVENYPCLYNTKLKEFKDIKIKRNAWKKVCEETKGTGNING